MNVATNEGSPETASHDAIALSVIIPARNEESQLEATLKAIRVARSHVGAHLVEVILVDNLSTDRTAEIARANSDVRYVRCNRLKAPCARNHGATLARGPVFAFVDADTRIPRCGLARILELAGRYRVGIFAIRGEGTGVRASCWWGFWNAVRHLPLPHAKAMPAFMFCTRAAFLAYGPFDESVVIGEEWPLTATCYRESRDRFIYDHTVHAETSNRRMERQSFGYTRTFLKYAWAILHRSGRVRYSDRIR
jgi:glycosyltransferase involved in cell wall biosynthesis